MHPHPLGLTLLEAQWATQARVRHTPRAKTGRMPATRPTQRALDGQTPLAGIGTDTRELLPGALFVALSGERFDGHRFLKEAFAKGACAALVAADRQDLWERASIDGPLLIVDDPVRAYGALARAHRRRLPGRVIAITGTNGKTTTKDMLAHVLGASARVVKTAANENNLIGVPKTLLSATDADEFIVLELGTNHPGEIARLARIALADFALLTSIAEGHLEGLGDLAGVAREKGALFASLPRTATAALPGDRLPALNIRRACRARCLTFGRDPRHTLFATEIDSTDAGTTAGTTAGEPGIRFMLNGTLPVRLPLVGAHNVENALGALSAAWWAGLPLSEAAARLATFQPPRWRLNCRSLGRGVGAVTLLVDCYNANPASTRAALAALAETAGPRRRIAVLGDMLELGRRATWHHQTLGASLAGSGICVLIAVGEAKLAGALAARAEAAGVQCVLHVANAETAGAAVLRLIEPGDAVLIKGSRRLRLERVADALEQAWAAGGLSGRRSRAA